MVAAPESTIDPATETGAAISIELRDDAEVLALAGRRVAAPGSTGLNPAFDVTPAALVTAIVTERRTISGRAAGEQPDQHGPDTAGEQPDQHGPDTAG